jgi:hypothetical protein
MLKEFPNVKDGDMDSCLLIANFVMEYVPKNSNFFKAAHQLPFILMANTIFGLTSFKKYQKKPFPLPKINSLNALELDVSQLFGLFGAINLKQPLCL